jgi:RNA polymerase sigma-70 factor (ECF subfamily)
VQLSGAQRDALQLRVVEEQSYQQVAAALGVSEQTARARVSRGLRSLARALEPDHAPTTESTLDRPAAQGGAS